MVTWRALGDVPRQLVASLARRLAVSRRARTTRAGTRALSCGRQAVVALVGFRERCPLPAVGRGMGICQATSYRYLDEAVGALAAQAPGLPAALQQGADQGWSPVVGDGTVVGSDRRSEKITSCTGTTLDAG